MLVLIAQDKELFPHLLVFGCLCDKQPRKQFYCCPDLLLSILLHVDASTAEVASFR